MINGEIEKMVMLSEDNEELNKLIIKFLKEYKKLEYEILHDSLTGAYNRRILEKEVDYDVVAMCDIDNFKQINDTYGHTTGGDKALSALGELFADNFRGGDFVTRYGGDEFAIVIRKCSMEVAYNKMEIIRKLAKIVLKEVLGYEGSISIGLAEYEPGKELKEAIEEADKALYESKSNGKDRITIYKKEKDLKVLEKVIS